MKKLYFIRHGLSEMNVQGVWSGQIETPLTQEGRAQARAAGKQLKDKGITIDYIVSSPLSRAHETAQIIAKQIDYPLEKIETNPLFLERSFGSLEGQPWNPDLNLDGIADIETTDTILKRARMALNYLESLDHETILLTAHSSIGRAIRHHLFEDQPYHAYMNKLENAVVHQWR